jgi:hypothetical protein
MMIEELLTKINKKYLTPGLTATGTAPIYCIKVLAVSGSFCIKVPAVSGT